MGEINRSLDAGGYDFRDKIVTPTQLCDLVTRLRGGAAVGHGPVVVQCHGCFDIVHPGHVRYLQFARTQGDVLVVSITGDAQINKGAQRPYIPQELRAENLAALSFVDYVVIDAHPTATQLLEQLRPDVYVKGREYASSEDPRFLEERDVVEGYGGRVVFSSGDVVFSSSRIVENMDRDTDLECARLAHICRRHGISEPALHELMRRAAGTRVVVVGDIVVERYALCDSGAMSAESPMMSLRQLEERDFLGAAAGVAMQLAALGAKPVLVTSIGRGSLSTWALSILKGAGVEVRALYGRDELPVKLRYIVDEQKLFKVERARHTPLDTLSEREAIQLLTAAADGSDAAIWQDGGYGFITPGLRRAFQQQIRPQIPIAMGTYAETGADLNGLRNLDLLCCSERRLRLALNDREGSLSTLAYRMLETTQARRLVVTVAKRGLVTFDRPSQDPAASAWHGRLYSEFLPTFAARPIDRLGAGDAMLAAMGLAFAAGGNLMQSAYFGGITCSVVVDRMGTQPASIDEVRRRIAGRSESHAGPQSNACYEEGIQPDMEREHALPFV